MKKILTEHMHLQYRLLWIESGISDHDSSVANLYQGFPDITHGRYIRALHRRGCYIEGVT